MNIFPSIAYETEYIYNQLMFVTYLCKKCKDNKCTGGYNCKHGTNLAELKVCRNDLMSGLCNNDTFVIPINEFIINKILEGATYNASKYVACKEGHHLTCRGLVPYNKYKQQIEINTKKTLQSIRYINDNITDNVINTNVSYESSTDDEINECFKKKYLSDLSSSDD